MNAADPVTKVDAWASASAETPEPQLVVPGRRRFSRLSIAFYRLIGVLGVLALWQIITQFHLVRRAFFPSPAKTYNTFVDLAHRNLAFHVGVTLKEALFGFLLGAAGGIVLGILLGVLPRVRETVSPFVTMMNAMPRIAMAPLLVIWFGIGSASHVALVFSLVFFIVLTNTIAGAESVERDLIIIARLSGARRDQVMRKVVLPSVVPWIVAAMRLSWAYALGGAIVGEMFLGQNGLGYLISEGSGVFNMAEIFAVLGVTVFIAWIFDNILRFVERKVLRWRPQNVG